MKSLVAIGMLMLALSLCNLMGRRSATNNSNNSNSNTNTQTASESSNQSAPSAPPLTGAAPGVPQISTENRKSAASEPPPPPKAKLTPPRAPISGGVLNGKAIKLAQPPYPPIARAAHASGQVTVQVLLDENGNVISATAVSGHPLLQPAAVAAARASKFTPTLLSGQPVKVTGVLIFNFREQ